MRPSIRKDLEEASAAIERLAKIMDSLERPEFVDFTARAKGLDSAITKLRDACGKQIKAKWLNGREGEILGEMFRASVTLVTSTALNQEALKERFPDVYAKCCEPRAVPTLKFDVR